jgi:hypothetical protein
MVKVLLVCILFMMVFMSICVIYWWKKYGKKIFNQFNQFNDLNKTFKNDMNFLKEFKIPNQWK